MGSLLKSEIILAKISILIRVPMCTKSTVVKQHCFSSFSCLGLLMLSTLVRR
jgi:hypothetical protein